MAEQYIKFKLLPGQSSPNDRNSTGLVLNEDWIVWKGPEGTFPKNDPYSKRPLEHHIMTDDEIVQFNKSIIENNPDSIDREHDKTEHMVENNTTEYDIYFEQDEDSIHDYQLPPDYMEIDEI